MDAVFQKGVQGIMEGKLNTGNGKGTTPEPTSQERALQDKLE